MEHLFRKFASTVSRIAGMPIAFLLAVSLVIIWAFTGPLFDYSTTWQLFINTCTTIVTFLMVFLIQNTQNRDSRAMQLKLDELIKAVHGARNSMMNIEELSDAELETFHQEFHKLHEKAKSEVEYRAKRKNGGKDLV